MSAPKVPQAVQVCHELLLWLIPLLDKFPKNRRFTLGERLESGLLKVLELLVAAAYSKDKVALLNQANRQLAVCRHLWRLCKPRLIAAAPFRDRVVHHALMNVLEPLLDRRFIADSYACRRGKGVHGAVARYQGWSRRYRYALKMDVQRYFPSIDRQLLKDKLRRMVKDDGVLWLLGRIIDTAPPELGVAWRFPGDDLLTPLERPTGIPIGNLTSQILANLYLNDFDHWVKQGRRQVAYLRYVDDMIVLDDDKRRLHELLAASRERLAPERLRLHPHKAQIVPTRSGLDVLGYRVYPECRRLRNGNGNRFARRLRGFAKAYARGEAEMSAFHPSVRAWIGHARHADTDALMERLFSEIVFRRESAGRPPGVARRLLEQQTPEGAFREPQQEPACEPQQQPRSAPRQSARCPELLRPRTEQV